jgi:hypothetical protein
MALAGRAKTRHHAGQVFGKKWLASCGAVTGFAIRREWISEGGFMSGWRRDVGLYSRLAGFLFVLSACTTNTPPIEAPPPTPDIPATIRPEEMVGRWGYGSYHNEGDRKRTEAAAHGQCGQPVVINRGPSGGVMMYLADSAQLQELYLKGSAGGRNYVGPPGPAGGPQDREVVAMDGRTMVLRWLNPEVQNRYGTGVYVRCGAEGASRKTPAKQQ